MTNISDVLKPIEIAHGLPNEAYISDTAYATERDSVVFAGWAGLTVAANVPAAGDALPIDFMGMPLLVVRGRDQQVRVFQNTCRHRGMILVSEPTKVGGVIRCPYHSWCYSHDGRLVTTPHVGGPGTNTADGVDRDTLGLIEIHSHVWRDIVFVNISGDAPAFADHAADLIARWSEFEDKPLVHGGADSRLTFDIACNWKLAVENYCESYHLPWVHPGLNSYSRLEDHYHIEADDRFAGQGTLVYRPSLGDGGQAFPDFAGLSDKWDSGAEYIALFPNVLLGVHRDHAFVIILQPMGPERTIEHVELYYADDAVAGEGARALRETNAAMWKEVFAEDVFVVEGMQKGRHGRFFDGGKFSPVMDNPTHCFHKWVARRLPETALAAE